MGMYTELFLAVRFKADTPQEIIDILTVCAGGKRTEENKQYGGPAKEVFVAKEDLPDGGANIFSSDRCWYLGRSKSYYFVADAHASLRYDRIAAAYYLTLIGNIKNYGGEIEEFLSWIAPYIDPRGHAGHMRYEEDPIPTLIFFEKDEVDPRFLLPWRWASSSTGDED